MAIRGWRGVFQPQPPPEPTYWNGQRIYTLRHSIDWTQKDLALELGINEFTVSALERDTREVSTMVARLLDTLEAQIQDAQRQPIPVPVVK